MADDLSIDNPNDEFEEIEELTPQLPQDNSAPFNIPTTGGLNPTHQATDSASDLDSQELYDEGLAGAAEASEPNRGNTVVGYHPENDQRKVTDKEDDNDV